MTIPHSVADSVTPAGRFRDAVYAAAPSTTARQFALILAAAKAYGDERVAAEAEAIARTPRSQEDPRYRGGGNVG